MNYWSLVISFILTFGAIPTFGQQSAVSGKVFELNEADSSLTPLAGANVYWSGTTIGTTTDNQGQFSLKVLKPSTNMVVRYTGFQPDTIDVSSKKSFTIVLQQGKILDDAIIESKVSATSFSLINPINVQVLGQKELCKAACCNLSESFETNPSVDASFTDAITGTRQIKMLGLDGKYTQILQDNLPTVRGINTLFGLDYIPGTWVNSIAIAKGTGSVVSGYESMTGQINTEMRSVQNSDKLLINLFTASNLRMEGNVNFIQKLPNNWGTAVLIHGEHLGKRWDNNGDNFLDNPLSDHFFVQNEWKYDTDKWHIQFGGGYVYFDQQAGSVNFRSLSESPNVYGVEMLNKKIYGSAKIGHVFDPDSYRSIGLQIHINKSNQSSLFGSNTYTAIQNAVNTNLIYQDLLGSSETHSYKVGANLQWDLIDEKSFGLDYSRNENAIGAFAEYTFKQSKWNLIAGGRIDQNNIYGILLNPRLHIRYTATENTSVKLSLGKGNRTANIFAENIGLLATSRKWKIQQENSKLPYGGLNMEEAWNLGLNLTNKFELFYQEGSLVVDAYHTSFTNQVVVDLDKNAQEVNIFNLNGPSFSNSIQAEINYEPFRRFDCRLAYRWLDVKTKYSAEILSKPMVATHRAFANLAYETKSKTNGAQWVSDLTITWTGSQRLPNTSEIPNQYQLPPKSSSFFTINGQITRRVKKLLDVYIGGENLLNFRQSNPIVSAHDPFGQYFDSSIVWGPIFGRMFYAGLRWAIE